MAGLSAETIRRLASFRGRKGPVVSLYLDVDGRRRIRPGDYERRFQLLLRRAAGMEGEDSVGTDLERISAHVMSGVDRSKVRGLAIFSCAPDDLWEVVEVPVEVRDQITVNDRPQISQLEQVTQASRRIGVLLADRQRARVLVLRLGEIVYHGERFDELPRHEDDKGEWDRDHVHDHQQAAARHHLRRAAEAAFAAFRQPGFDALVVSAPEEMEPELERELHSYLRDRLVSVWRLPVSASDEEVRAAVAAVEDELERKRVAELVTALRDGLGRQRAVTGLGDVLAALVERRVETLVVSPGFEAPGWRCPSCSYLAVLGPGCPVCGEAMDRVEDVVEEAVAAALQASCSVVSCPGCADLDVMGRIGALLRY